ncbi:hypothetical protein [Stenotrophomonas sp. MMGLT7]|uniref:hypothetical protein n=1 Tax=Stenotrophomonas sp. MMGLT7 TaxID=2901227 RepID=UPI001E42FC74|nr:hypothetical protein [Stenotrophomonas sp. MMGLT7]MCD7098049.1 hypothetical protein [Stenotrophomonas sp. MMGLT7]
MLVHDVVVEEDGEHAVGLFVRSDGRCVLNVPIGMSDMDPSHALALLYKSFAVFRRTRRSNERLAALDGIERWPRGGLDRGEGGTSFCDAMGLDELFDRGDPLHLLSLCKRRVLQSRNVHRQLERHLHLALFDDDAVPYLDRVHGPHREIRHGTSDIVDLYCFVAEDFYRNFLDVDPANVWGSFSREAVALSANFRRRYLTSGDSLFVADRQESERTRRQLQHLLHRIDRNTPMRSLHYRMLYDALDRYLHAGHASARREGQIWGVRDFWAVWESICLYHAAVGADGEDLDSFLTCDFEHLPPGLAEPALEKRWRERRQALFARNGIQRRPDLVQASETRVRVVDFKYYRDPPMRRPRWTDDALLQKRERDFLNMEVYGLLMHNHLLREPGQDSREIALEFWVPGTCASHTPLVDEPGWEPSLSIITLSTAQVIERYSRLYVHVASDTVEQSAYRPRPETP